MRSDNMFPRRNKNLSVLLDRKTILSKSIGMSLLWIELELEFYGWVNIIKVV